MSNDNQKILDLEAKLASYVQETSRLRKDLKDATHKHGVLQTLASELQSTVVPLEEFPPMPDIRRGKKADLVEEDLVIHLSDLHGDEVVKPHSVGGLEEFDFPIALCRGENFVDSVIKFTQQTLANYRFKTLHLLMYGDMTNGEIHGGVTHSYYQNMFRNCLAIGQLCGLMIRDWAPWFPQVKVVCVPGNHGRRTLKKEFNGPWNNWDYLIYEIASTYCRNLKNVEFAIPECFSVNYDILGHTFHIEHGDDIKSWNSIPWYGIERKTRRLVSLNNSIGKQVRYFVMGHFHALANMADLKGETFINGAWVGTTPYSYESFSGYREPMQLIHGVHADHGVTWRLPVLLRNKEREAAGPSRYNVILANESFGAH